MQSGQIMGGKFTVHCCAAVLSACLLSSCSGTTDTESPAFGVPLDSTFSVDKDQIILHVQDREERERYQLMIVRLTGILSSEKTTPEQRAQILYNMGILYDRLGMDVSARNMFMNALIELPDYAAAYNFLGTYLSAAERFAEAYDAFDSVLELKPDETYAYFNRGIALYYGNRPELAAEDLLKFYNFDKNDPFRSAWLYIVERNIYGKEKADQSLKERRALIDTEKSGWGTEVLDFMSGEIDADMLIDSIRFSGSDKAEQNRRLCEAYFYMGKMAQFAGDHKRAYDLLHLCAVTNVTGYLEYRYAVLEIERYQRAEKAADEARVAEKQQAEREEMLRRQTEEILKQLQQDGKKEAVPENNRKKVPDDGGVLLRVSGGN